MTKYVKARSGSRFGVLAKFADDFETEHGICMIVDIDGRDIWDRVIGYEELDHPGGSLLYDIRERKSGKWYSTGLCFSNLEIGNWTLPLSRDWADSIFQLSNQTMVWSPYQTKSAEV